MAITSPRLSRAAATARAGLHVEPLDRRVYLSGSLSGRWEGVWTHEGNDYTYSFTLHANANGTVSGDGVETNRSYYFPFSVSGTVDGDHVTMVAHIGDEWRMDGTLSETTLSGDLTDIHFEESGVPELVARAHGTFSLTQVEAFDDPVDLRPTQLAFDADDGGINVSYSIDGGPLDGATSVRLYWATGTTAAAKTRAITTLPVAARSPGSYGPFHVPASLLSDPPAGSTHILAIVDPDGAVKEADEANNVLAVAAPAESTADFSATRLAWDAKRGGLEFDYHVDVAKPKAGKRRPAPANTTAAVFWSATSSAGGRIGDPLFSVPVRAAKTATVRRVHIPGTALRGPVPPEARYLVLVLDPDGRVSETRESNNAKAVADVRLTPPSNPPVDQDTGQPFTVSQATLDAAKRIMREAGQPTAVISSSIRTPEQQAAAMFDNLVGKRFNGTKSPRYRAPGQAVEAVYYRMTKGLKTRKQFAAARADVVKAMLAEIGHQGPYNVSHHVASPEQWRRVNVIDIPPNTSHIKNRKLFERAGNAAKADGLLTAFLAPDNNGDPAFHLEVPQPIILA